MKRHNPAWVRHALTLSVVAACLGSGAVPMASRGTDDEPVAREDQGSSRDDRDRDDRRAIQHVVVIFQENVSFDHYFATYPRAAFTRMG